MTLLDTFFAVTPKKLLIKDLHATGVVCMFIASKYEDIYPLKLRVVHDKIAHGKIDEQSMVNMEMDILHSLDFQARQPTILDFMSIFCEFVVKQSLTIAQLTDNFELIELLTIYLAKLLLHDYELS